MGVATGGATKLLEALTTKQAAAMFKGKVLLDAGYFYAPYIPLQVTPTILRKDGVTKQIIRQGVHRAKAL